MTKRVRATIAVIGLAIGALCVAPAALAANTVYWANERTPPVPAISFAGLGGTGGGVLNTTGAAANDEAGGVAIDSATGMIYWADYASNTISYANLNGTGGGDLSTTGTTPNGPYGVAIDPATNKLYWANYTSGTIGYANLTGGGGGLLNTAGATLSYPSGVALEPAGGKIYWSNQGSNTFPIAYANLNGTGGGDLTTSGATADSPNGLAIDAATNMIYWANSNNNTISYANLTEGGGGQLDTTGATTDLVQGVAIDPAAGKLYWGNYSSSTSPISFANLNGSGGGDLPGAGSGSMASGAGFPALLEVPAAAGAPKIASGSAPGSTLSCSAGTWAPDLLGSFLYQAPQSFAYAWSENGVPINGATSSSITANSAGSYRCSVTASNHAGSTTRSSAAFTVSQLRASVGDQQITLRTPSPSVCTANTSKLSATLDSTKIPNSKAAKLTFSGAAFYIDKGVEHKRHKTKHERNGKTKKVVVITYTANATKHHVPVSVDLSLAGFKPGTHTLKVVVSYKRTERKHGHKKSVTVKKTVKVNFTIC